MKLDTIHYNSSKIDGYPQSIKFINSGRNAGKTTIIFLKALKKRQKEHKTTLVFRRRIVDITDVYIDSLFEIFNKFNDGPDYEPVYDKGSKKEGVVDVKIKVYSQEHPKGFVSSTPIFRIIAVSVPMSRIKSTMLRTVGLGIFDEYICNTKLGERYLKNEAFAFNEIYNTYVRECPNLVVYFLGNPYSRYNPYHTWFKIPTSKIKAGCFLVGPNWVFEAYDLSPELIKWLKENNPQYKDEDDEYTKYGLRGEAINDVNIELEPVQPQNAKLFYVFRIDDTYVGFFRVNTLERWASRLPDWNASNRREVFCFDFNNLVDGTVMLSKMMKAILENLCLAIGQRMITYKDLETGYLTQEIYPFIGG